MQIDYDILFNSPTMRSNLSTISESLDEVVFTVDAGDDTFTVGYYLGDEIYSLEKIMQQIEITVDEINSDVKTEARVSSNNHILLSDLQLMLIQMKHLRWKLFSITTTSRQQVRTTKAMRFN